jgi:hypothetical protein
MRITRIGNLFSFVLLSAIGVTTRLSAAPAPPPQPTPEERIAAVKQSFAQSQALLHKYEWIETTVTSLKGEEKSQVQKRCFYGAEGTLQKVAVSAPPEDQPGRGLRGRIKEKKKQELTAYMEEAAALLQNYIPPDPARIQAVREAGKVSIQIVDPGKRAKLVLSDYFKPGDSLSIEIDLTSNRILGAGVDTTLGKDADPVTLDLRFDTFPDGTIYNSRSTLDAKAKKVTVVVQNGGYRQTVP